MISDASPNAWAWHDMACRPDGSKHNSTCVADAREGRAASLLVGCLQMTNEVMSKAGIPAVSTWNDTLPLWESNRDNGHAWSALASPQLVTECPEMIACR